MPSHPEPPPLLPDSDFVHINVKTTTKEERLEEEEASGVVSSLAEVVFTYVSSVSEKLQGVVKIVREKFQVPGVSGVLNFVARD